MKKAVAVLVVVFLVLGVAGAVLAAEMSGAVKAVDTTKGVLTLTSGSLEVPFDCEQPMMANVKVGDKVTVEYTEKDGKKVATKISAEKAAPKPQVGC
jgi:ABC-type molybdate transport system substrate-binding protein